MASTRLTKADLLAKIAALESELGLAKVTAAQLQREIDAEMVAARPSRAARLERSSTDFEHTQPAPRRIAHVAPSRVLPEHFARARELAMRTGCVVRC